MLRSQGIKIGLDEETLKTFYLMYWCKSLTEKSKTSIVCLLNRRYDQLGAQWEKSLKKKGLKNQENWQLWQPSKYSQVQQNNKQQAFYFAYVLAKDRSLSTWAAAYSHILFAATCKQFGEGSFLFRCDDALVHRKKKFSEFAEELFLHRALK